MMKKGNRRLYQEMMARIKILHRHHQARMGQVDLSLQPPGACSTHPLPYTMDSYIWAEMKKRRGDKVPLPVADLAKSYAMNIPDGIEPNPIIRAAFGVERALWDMSLWSPFQEAVPNIFIDGVPFLLDEDIITGKISTERWDAPDGPDDDGPYGQYNGLAPVDLASIRILPISMGAIFATGLLPAAWTPKYPSVSFTTDVLRAPVEVLALTAEVLEVEILSNINPFWRDLHHVQDFDSTKTVGCIGLGFGVSAQCLSARLPMVEVYNQPMIWNPNRRLPAPPDATILGLPSFHQYAVAKVLAGDVTLSFLERRKLFEAGKQLQGITDHVPELIRAAQAVKKVGALLVLVGNLETHFQAVATLQMDKLVAPLDSSKGPVWSGYAKSPWAPHKFPAPAGKVISFWRWM